MGRIISIVHRVKRTKENEPRPTKVFIQDGRSNQDLVLETETDELDFVLGRFPVKFRKVKADEDLGSFIDRQIHWRKLKKTEKPDDFPENLIANDGKDYLVATKVPEKFEGLRQGDQVVMILGGSGDILAYTIAKNQEKFGVNICRIPPGVLKEKRTENAKNDHVFLTRLFEDSPTLFQEVTLRDMNIIRLRETFFQRQDAMKDRIKCEQRLRQRLIGSVFLADDEAGYPEGNIEAAFDDLKANDQILAALLQEEGAREKELKKCVRSLDIWTELFEPIEGVGEMIAARIIASVGDIRRFPTVAKFKAYCGAHLRADGSFPRKRSGETANWQNEIRQALYLLGDQANRRPNSKWGKILRKYKEQFRQKHPDVLCQQCGCKWEECESQKSHTRKYTPAHIHRMATWRTITKFVEWLYWEWNVILNEVGEEAA